MGNRRFHEIERFHTSGTTESERLKVTAPNLFHPTASSPFLESHFHLAIQSKEGMKDLLQRRNRLILCDF
jgi:hypothetical protein